MHPILFSVGPVTLYSYGLMVAFGFLVASTYATRRGRAAGVDPALIQSLSLWVLVAGLAGARAVYVLLNWEFFRRDWMEIFRVNHGGLVFYGGLAAGLLVGLWILFKNKLLRWEVVGLMILPLVIAHAIGRVGCFLNGCCYGKPTRLPWAVSLPMDGIPSQPTQLYEAGALLLIFFFLWMMERRKVRPGTVALAYGVFYGIWRFWIEFFRGDNPVGVGGLTVFQWMSLGLVAVCGSLLARCLVKEWANG